MSWGLSGDERGRIIEVKLRGGWESVTMRVGDATLVLENGIGIELRWQISWRGYSKEAAGEIRA